MSTDENQTEPVAAQNATELELDLEEEPSAPKVEGAKKFDEMTQEELLAVAKKQHGMLKRPAPKQPLIKKGGEVGDLGTRLSNLELLEKKRQFGYDMGLSPEQTDRVFRFSDNPTKETLEDEFVKAGLEALNRKKRLADATPSPTGKSSKVEGKSFGELKPSERSANFEKLRKSMLG